MNLHIFLISDFSLIHDGIAALLKSGNQPIELIGTSASLSQAVNKIEKIAIDIILLDIDSESSEIPLLIGKLNTISKAKILLLTRLDNVKLQDAAMLQGAHGVLRKDTTAEQLVSAISKVAKGEIWLDRTATARLFVEFARTKNKSPDLDSGKLELLIRREREIIDYVVNSNSSSKVIASDLSISESTLRNHLTTIYEKLGVANRHGLLSFAFEHNLISNTPPTSNPDR